jgi:hypothetical protein
MKRTGGRALVKPRGLTLVIRRRPPPRSAFFPSERTRILLHHAEAVICKPRVKVYAVGAQAPPVQRVRSRFPPDRPRTACADRRHKSHVEPSGCHEAYPAAREAAAAGIQARADHRCPEVPPAAGEPESENAIQRHRRAARGLSLDCALTTDGVAETDADSVADSAADGRSRSRLLRARRHRSCDRGCERPPMTEWEARNADSSPESRLRSLPCILWAKDPPKHSGQRELESLGSLIVRHLLLARPT